MLTSISPVGEHGRNQRWLITVSAYAVGSVLGGAVSGAGLGALGRLTLGWLPGSAVLALFAILAVVGLLLEGHVAGVRLPTWRRQVDERWLVRYRGWVYGFGFGFQLGTAFMTIVTSAVVYLTFAAALLSMSWTAGAVIGGIFGAVRSLPLVGMWRVRRTATLVAVHSRLQRLTVPVARVTILVQAATAVAVGIAGAGALR